MRRHDNTTQKKLTSVLTFILVLIILPVVFGTVFSSQSENTSGLSTPVVQTSPCIWQICSIDTMKTSRDLARTHLNNPAYDSEIQNQLRLIKQTGASYVSITTPYDEEFRPYLKRWVTLARQEGLKVWFRGNWSSWEGWFGYPKDMSPEQHLIKNSQFITSNTALFQNGDIFDPCPECENAAFWPQDAKNQDYRNFLQTQQKQTKEDFKKINKQVRVLPSVIGGRAKDVLDKQSFDSLDKIISIDHYIKQPQGMAEYVDYFDKKFDTKVLVSEFGAPIPDMNGPMDEKQQAAFIKSILETLYKKGDKVVGLNYWVLSEGTTMLVNNDGSTRLAYDIVKQYFNPSVVEGRVTDSLDQGVSGLVVKTTDNASVTKTNENGYFQLHIPPRKFEIVVDDPSFYSQTASLTTTTSGEKISYNFFVAPKNPGIWYKLKLFWKNTIHKS